MTITKDYFKLQNDFVKDLAKLSEIEIRVYLVLRSLVNEKRQDGNKVFCGYDYMEEITGLSSSSIRKAIIGLVAKGWIEHVERGGLKNSNKYYLPDNKISSPRSKELENISKKRKIKPSSSSLGNLSSPRNEELSREAVLHHAESNNTKTINKTTKKPNDSKERSIQPNGFLSGKAVVSEFADLFED